MDEFALRNQSQNQYVRGFSRAWRNAVQVFEPSVWLNRDPGAEEKMLRDADIAHAVGFRRHQIAGRQWTLTPRDDASDFSELAVSVGTELLGGIKHFTQSRLNLARAFFSGARFARIHHEPRTMTIGDGRPRTWLVPTRLEDLDKRMYRIVPDLERKEDGTQVIRAHWERWNVAEAAWEDENLEDAIQTIRHVYQDDQATLGHGRALREALGWIWYTKTHVMQEAVQAVEKFAQGTIHVEVDMLRDAETGLPNATLVDEYVSTIEDMRARHVLVTDKADNVTVLSGNADGWQLLDMMETKLRNSVLTLVLGANLPTGGGGSEAGSFARAKVEENSTEALIQYDRETLEETLTDDLLGCVWFKNHANLAELGIAAEKPRFSITQEKILDPKERADIAAVMHGMGAPLALDDLYDQTGWRKPEEGEDVLEGATEPVPAGFGFNGSEPFGVGVPGFGLPDAAAPSIDPIELQETAMNGAQVTAAAELIVSVVNGNMPPGTAVRMLVSMFNLPQREAQAMIDEAVTFQPASALAAPIVESVNPVGVN